MNIVAFSLRGKMAHFRKYYSNSSALSYFVPPRTTICGIVAGLLGYERDTYYDDFSLDNFKVAIAMEKPVKKTIQKMNYLMIDTVNDLNGSNEYYSQTPMELVIPENIYDGFVGYKIWATHKNREIMQKIEKLFFGYKESYYKSYGISLALGSAFNIGWVEVEGIIEGQEIKPDSYRVVSSIISTEMTKEIKTDKMTDGVYKILKEELPIEFDYNRRITGRGLKDFLITAAGGPIVVDSNSLVELNDGKYIAWME